MTRDEILNMPAGREMDVTIGYHVMDLNMHPNWYPDYSKNIMDAWRVAEKMTQIYPYWSIGKSFGPLTTTDQWVVIWGIDGDDTGYQTVTAETAPLAICRAALLAVLESAE